MKTQFSYRSLKSGNVDFDQRYRLHWRRTPTSGYSVISTNSPRLACYFLTQASTDGCINVCLIDNESGTFWFTPVSAALVLKTFPEPNYVKVCDYKNI